MSKYGLIDKSIEGRQHVYFPHFTANRVPTEPGANAVWRRKAFLANKAQQKQLRKMCAEDLLFWIFGFVSIFDSGDESDNPGPIPFLLHEYQIECMTTMWAAMHDLRKPLREKKPRRAGATWRMICLYEHCWQFMKNRHLLVGSHREEQVEGTASTSKGGLFVGEWSRLLPKFDFVQVHQPPWLLPEGFKPRVEPYRTRLKIMNPENGSIIWGTSASTVAGHGERGYSAWWDEASRTENLYEIIGGLQAFSKSKFWISTIGNLDHPFSTILKDAPGIMQLEPQWWMDPVYSEGLTIDPVSGKRISPWLIGKLAEINNDPVKANELYYADESQQIGGYYSRDSFRTMVGTSDNPGTVMDPFAIGEMDIMDQKEGPRVVRFCNQPSGRWKFWFQPDATGRPPRDTRYIFGIDTAAGNADTGGRGASNSVIAVCDWRTGEIVAEFVTSGLQPYELARVAVAAGLWFEGDDFQGALMVPESNGPGNQLIDCLVNKQRYGNVYTPDPTEMKYGWFKDGRGDAARLAFGLHQEMICNGRFKERSMDCVREMRHYQHNPNGKGAPIHSASILSDDPSGARDNHGDRVIARICICQPLQKPYNTLKKKGEPAFGSYRWLMESKKKTRADEMELV